MKSPRLSPSLGWPTLLIVSKPPRASPNGGSTTSPPALTASPILSRSVDGIGLSLHCPPLFFLSHYFHCFVLQIHDFSFIISLIAVSLDNYIIHCMRFSKFFMCFVFLGWSVLLGLWYYCFAVLINRNQEFIDYCIMGCSNSLWSNIFVLIRWSILVDYEGFATVTKMK